MLKAINTVNVDLTARVTSQDDWGVSAEGNHSLGNI